MKDVKEKILIIDAGFTEDEKTRQAGLKAVIKMIEEAFEAMERAERKATQKASAERKGNE